MEYKVLFHIDELNKWQLLLANIQNLINSPDENSYKVEVVANAAAVGYYVQSLEHTEMDLLAQQEVTFCACNNALQTLAIPVTNLAKYVIVVPAGVKELVTRQEEGYSYIKP